MEAPDPAATVDAPELEALKGFTFLHISSAFPRKGVDVLLEAYFDAFDSRSDVSLILKTFPNPHNEVEGILERLRAGHPNPPDVRWIDRDLEDREIEALYGLADCYVHPARGEGFGLPVAEAMAAGVPVISGGLLGAGRLRLGGDGDDHPLHPGGGPDPPGTGRLHLGRARWSGNWPSS